MDTTTQLSTSPPTTNVVHAGNCLEALKSLGDKSIEHTISDPPYSMHVHRNVVNLGNNEPTTVDLGFDALTLDSMVSYAIQIVRVTKRWILLFCAAEQVTDWKRALEYAGAIWKRTCIWEKPDAQPQLTGDRPGQGFEPICAAYGSVGKCRWNAGGKLGIYKAPIPRGDARTHPTEKPIKLMKQLIADFTEPGDTILDPFSGTGSTHVAASHLGRNSIGYEINPEYVEIANLRIQGRWFRDQRQVTIYDMLEGKKPIQEKLIAEEKILKLVEKAKAKPSSLNAEVVEELSSARAALEHSQSMDAASEVATPRTFDIQPQEAMPCQDSMGASRDDSSQEAKAQEDFWGPDHS